MTSRQRTLVLITAIGVAILVALGWWQKERLAWKTAKIAEIEASANSAPLTTAADILSARAAGEPLDFRRAALEVAPVPDAPVFRVFRAGEGIRWELFTAVDAGGDTLFASFQTVREAAPAIVEVPPRIVGYIRSYDELPSGRYTVEDNRYYGFNPDGVWSARIAAVPDLYIDVEMGATEAGGLPPRMPELPNNHFQYMLTWWSFAVILVVFATLLYRRES